MMKKMKGGRIQLYVSLGGIILMSGCSFVPDRPSYYSNDYCYNKARIAVNQLHPKFRNFDEAEVQKATYDNCIMDRKRGKSIVGR